jgi:hypothetical protein
MWFDRLYDIDRGISGAHSNYFSDPISIGLLDSSADPPMLSPSGKSFLALRHILRNNPLRAEYELLKILYFSGIHHEQSVDHFLAAKRDHLFTVLGQITPSPSRHLFLTHPKLLVIAELVSGFTGAICRLLNLAEDDLLLLDGLGERGFMELCSGGSFPEGLDRLCKKIGGDYTRGDERRLHYLVSMALLSIARELPQGAAARLVIPSPFCNLLTETDIHSLHDQYTSDISVWFDGVNFLVSSSLAMSPGFPVPPVPSVQILAIQPQTGVPAGRNTASATDQSRRGRRSAKRLQTTIVIDQVVSERAEDLAEERLLRPQHGDQLERAGHRAGELIALPDGMVPGADFYVTDTSDTPIEFIEIKSVTGRPPFDVVLTRAEYMRAVKCVANGIEYRLILVDLGSGNFYEWADYAPALSTLELTEVIQFVVRLSAPNLQR